MPHLPQTKLSKSNKGATKHKVRPTSPAKSTGDKFLASIDKGLNRSPVHLAREGRSPPLRLDEKANYTGIVFPRQPPKRVFLEKIFAAPIHPAGTDNVKFNRPTGYAEARSPLPNPQNPFATKPSAPRRAKGLYRLLSYVQATEKVFFCDFRPAVDRRTWIRSFVAPLVTRSVSEDRSTTKPRSRFGLRIRAPRCALRDLGWPKGKATAIPTPNDVCVSPGRPC